MLRNGGGNSKIIILHIMHIMLNYNTSSNSYSSNSTMYAEIRSLIQMRSISVAESKLNSIKTKRC